jgi:hypothetical protein
MTLRLCITTAYDDAYCTLGELCTASIIRYAQTFGYDYRIFVNRPIVRDHSFDKLLIIQELFAEGYEFVFWIDSDALFVRFDRDIGAEIRPDKHFYLTCYTVTLAPMPRVLTTFEVPLAGFLLLRNTSWSRELLETMWNQTQYLNTQVRDNAALLEILGYHYVLDLALHPAKTTSEQLNRPDFNYWKFIHRLDASWHGMRGVPPIHPVAEPVIVHYPAQPLSQRILSMQRDYARAVSQTAPELVTTLDYDFSQPIDGDGWYASEYSEVAHCWYRWSGRESATLNVALVPDRDYQLSFLVLQTLDPSEQNEFQLLINEQPILLESEPAVYGQRYTGTIRCDWLELSRPYAQITFRVAQLHSPQEFFATPDSRLLGLAIAALHIESEG